jgi:hypothetical protein
MTEPHPDLHEAYQSAKQITRGGKQAADDQAMEAMWQAMERGESKEEAEKQFSETYLKVVHGK